MTIRISREPFMNSGQAAAAFALIGPAWLTMTGDRVLTDVPVSRGLTRFLAAALRMTWPGQYAYGTVYATMLDGEAREAGPWHYDLGEYTAEGSERFVSTWRSDGCEIGNVFKLPDGEWRQAPNLHVTAFHEGSDYHRSPAAPAVSGAYGVFMSATFYRAGDPANLGCPRLAELRDRGPYADLAKLHDVVTRSNYETSMK